MQISTRIAAKIALLTAVCALGCVFATPANASLTSLDDQVTAAATSQTLTYTPNPVNLNDLDHHYSYSWRIDNISLSNLAITSASLTFTNIANWDSNPNRLFVYLLDTATQPGVNTFQDHPLNEAPIGNIVDHFANGAVIPSLITASTAKIKLFDISFTTTPTTYTYSFSPAQIATLTQYINNGHDIAFGFDPECHFFNDGIKFTINVTPVPEVGTILPIAVLLASVIGLEIRRRRRVTD